VIEEQEAGLGQRQKLLHGDWRGWRATASRMALGGSGQRSAMVAGELQNTRFDGGVCRVPNRRSSARVRKCHQGGFRRSADDG
jgi:hypothetical protein